MKDLLVYLVQDSGAELNAEARAADLKADPRTVRDWVRRLTETLLVVPLDRFSRHAAASLRARSKVFAADLGLVNAFALSPVQDPGVRAKVFEAAVFRHLRALARRAGADLSYFRQDEQLEIDFVFARGGETTGIEVTSSPRVRPDKLDKLRRAGTALGAGRLLLVHGGMVDEPFPGGRAVPLSRFLLDPWEFLREAP